jgi:hypothetical protein
MFPKIFALLLGLAFALVGNAYRALAYRMRSFKTAPGTIVARAVVVVPSGNTSTGRWGEGGGYTPHVKYRYVVDGVELESDKLARAIRGYKRSVAERKLAEIPDRVTVFYDPQRPSEAYLQKHGPAVGYLLMTLGAGLVVGALVALVS